MNTPPPPSYKVFLRAGSSLPFTDARFALTGTEVSVQWDCAVSIETQTISFEIPIKVGRQSRFKEIGRLSLSQITLVLNATGAQHWPEPKQD